MKHSMRLLRVYTDTSVFGGCLDVEFADDSWHLIEAIKEGRLLLLVSEVVVRELQHAPEAVRAILPSIPVEMVEPVTLTTEMIELRDAYLAAGILNPRWIDDALHVAVATVARADAIVSWNFKHIVRLDKMRAYNQVNLLNGYGILTIVSPREVVLDDNE